MIRIILDVIYEQRFVIIRWVLMMGAGMVVSCAYEHSNSVADDSAGPCQFSITCTMHK